MSHSRVRVGEHGCRLLVCLVPVVVFGVGLVFGPLEQSVAAPPEAAGAQADPFQVGMRLFDTKQYDRAIGAFNAAIQRNPSYAEAYYRRGECWRKTWWLDRAKKDFQQAIQLDPNHVQAHFGKALVDETTDYWDEAIAGYTKAIRLDPGLPLPWIRRGGLFWNRGDHHRATADLDRGIVLCMKKIAQNTADANTYRARALAYHTRKQYDKAAADYAEMLRLDPGNVEGLVERGRTLAAKRDKPGSDADFLTAIAICTDTLQRQPDDLHAYRQRAIARNAKAFAWKERDDFLAALSDYDGVVARSPGCAAAVFHRGHCHAGASHYAGDPDGALYRKALADLTEALRLDPTYVAAWRERGMCRTRHAIQSGDPTDAEAGAADLTEMIRLVPRAARAYCGRAGAYGAARKLDQSMADLDKAVELCPTMAEAYELRGRLNMAFGHTDAARADLARAQELQAALR
ncbi:MAG: tetratricopeptide repeat protein [Pirellulales bacterium]|nr:tetratricopeptide repeat protein [Pirellulales bacterium]